jgi:DNA-binding MarR family transcriptional regulator
MYMGNTCTIKIVYDYNADNFDHSDLDFIGGSQLYSEPCEREPVNSVDGLKDSQGRAWGAEWKEQIRKNWDSYAQIVTEGESLPYLDQFVDLDPNYRDKWGDPLLRITFDWHDNQRAMWRFIAKKALGIMEAMKPTKIIDFKPEIPPTTSPSTSQRTDRRLRHGHESRPFGHQHLRTGLGYAERVRHRRCPLPPESGCEPDRNNRRGHLPNGGGDWRSLFQESERPPQLTHGDGGNEQAVRCPTPIEQIIQIATFRAELRTFLRHSEQVARRWQLTPQRFLLLLTIEGAPDRSGRLSLTEIAERLSLSRNTVTELCSRAEEAGLLSRDDAEEDRRLVYLELTREAERRLFGALNEMDEHRGDISKAFDELTRSVRQARR